MKKLNRGTAADKVLSDKAFNTAINPKHDGYQQQVASLVYKFVDKKSSGRGIKIIIIKELAEELRKWIIKTYYCLIIPLIIYLISSLIDNIWDVDIADMQLISKFNNRFKFSLCVIDIYSKYAWVVILKNKKGITITNAFQKVANQIKNE